MGQLPTVLLVEDDENDILLFCRGLKRKSIRARAKVIANGHDAILYLKGEGVYENRTACPLPGLVILDLHIPGSPGLAVLQWIRKQPQLTGLPVVVFTGTDRGCSVREVMQSGADTYLFKGHDMDGLLHLLKHADLTWKPQKQSGDLQQI